MLCAEGSPLAVLLAAWRVEHDTLVNRYVNAPLATLTQQHISELERAVADTLETRLSLVEAAKVCGFSESSLGRQIRDGELKNVGRKFAPVVLRGDLPYRSGMLRGLRDDEHSPTLSLTRKQIARVAIAPFVGEMSNG